MRSRLLYGIDERPKRKSESILLGLQQAAVLFTGLVITPVIVGNMAGLDTIQMGKLLSACAVGSGIATLLQIHFGSRLPIAQGTAISVVGAASIIMGLVDGSPTEKMATVCFAMMLCGIIQSCIGFGKIIGHIRKIMTPVVVGPVVMLIGLALFPWAIDTASSNLIFSLIMVAIVFIFNYYMGTKLAPYSALIALALGYIYALVGTTTGFIEPGNALYIDFSGVANASWFAIPMPFQWGMPKFNLAFVLVMFAPFFAIMVESIGGYLTIAEATDSPIPTAKQLNNGIAMEGLGSVITTLLGGTGSTNYSQNSALIVLTKVASKYVFSIASVIVIIIGFIPKIGTLFGSIPGPIIGGVYLATFGLIVGVGASMLNNADLKSDRNMTVVGLSLFLGLALPQYISQYPIVIASASWLADIVNGLLGTSMAVGGIVAIFLDNVLPGKEKNDDSSKVVGE